jgi:hypothetical protein
VRLKIATGILILALLTVFIAGCTSTQNSTQNQGNSTATLSNSISISAQAVQSPQQIGNSSIFGIPKSGDDFVMYNVTLANINAVEGPATTASKFTVQDTNNNSYGVSETIQTEYLGHAFPSSGDVLAPGERMNGLIVFEVPQGVKLVTMTYYDHNLITDATFRQVTNL